MQLSDPLQIMPVDHGMHFVKFHSENESYVYVLEDGTSYLVMKT